jgi:hypothetical protein
MFSEIEKCIELMAETMVTQERSFGLFDGVGGIRPCSGESSPAD